MSYVPYPFHGNPKAYLWSELNRIAAAIGGGGSGVTSVTVTSDLVATPDPIVATGTIGLSASTLADLALATSALQPADVAPLYAATFLTTADEHTLLANSRQLLAGTNITFDDSVAHQRTVNASGGSSSPLTTKGDIYVFSTVDDRLPVGTNGYALSADSTQTTGLKWIPNIAVSAPEQRGASFSGGASAIVVPTNDVTVNIREDCTITSVRLLTRGGTGSCVVDIWRKAYGAYPPTSADSICGSGKPTISSGIKYEDTTFTGWSSTTLSAGDTLLVNLASCSTFTVVALWITLTPVGSTAFNGYTDQRAQDAVGGILTDTATVDFTYDGTAHTIKADVITTGLSVFDSTHKGVVPASGGSSSQYLSADGTFTTPSGTTAETTGTFTATLKYGTTPSTSQTGTWRWTKIGNMVMLWIPKHTLTQVTDLGSSLVVNGLPTGIRPTNPTAVPCFVLDGSVSGLAIPGLMLIAAVTDNIGPNVDFGKYTSGGPGFTTNFATGLNGYTVGLQMYGTAGEGQAVSYCLN